jgi:hypothetical protein
MGHHHNNIQAEGGDEPHFPNLTKPLEASPTTSNYILLYAASGSAPTTSPKLASLAVQGPILSGPRLFHLVLRLAPSIGSSLAADEPAQSDLEHDNDAIPKIRNP